jgi:2-oxoglutarate/2-oxoacid ferredoxin oxidoreductase subunit alpha
MINRRKRKLSNLAIGGKPVPGVEVTGPARPDVLLISYGSTIGAVHEAAGNLAAEGMSVGVCQVRLLNPLPVEELTALVNGARNVIVIENNSEGQLAYLMRANRVPYGNVQSMLKYDGTLFRGDEVTAKVKQMIAVPQAAERPAQEVRA